MKVREFIALTADDLLFIPTRIKNKTLYSQKKQTSKFILTMEFKMIKRTFEKAQVRQHPVCSDPGNEVSKKED